MSIELPENMIEQNISVVLTDIIGSTRFVQRNGSRVAAKWFSIHDKAVMNFIARHQGQLIDASDGHLIMFATVSDAIGFAFEYKKYLRKKKFPFRSRIGIHWDKMLIVRSEAHIVRAGGKRLNLEGIGKNIAARTMSICEPEQILLSKSAFMQYKKYGHRSNFIPKKAQSALVGLYKFKGVAEPESIYAIGLIESQLQPPADGEKAKRIGGARKIKTRLRNKTLNGIFWWIMYRLSFAILLYYIWGLIRIASAFHGNAIFYTMTGIDLNYYIGWVYPLICEIYAYLQNIILGS